MVKEAAYVYSLSLTAIAHNIAMACSSNLISGCGCDGESSSCPENVNYALGVAEAFLNKRYRRHGQTLSVSLIQQNLAAAKQVT